MEAATCITMSSLVLYFKKWSLLALLCLEIYVSASVEVMRPRGVALTKKVFYDPSKDFTCLDGSATIPFHYVNDDYCDCVDGTDEPGTAACPNGYFHCTNAGFKPLNIPSSRVNDGICDCCDASDEYNSTANCINHCKDLGRKAKEDAQRHFELLTKGFELKQEYSKQGRAFMEERKQKLNELEQEKENQSKIKENKEEIKIKAEELEKEALDQYKNEEEEKKKEEEAKRLEEEREKELLAAFEDLDANKDGKISIEEIQGRWVFDQNKDGEVTVEEAKFFLINRNEIDLEEFRKTGWIMMKPHYSLQNMFKPPEADGSTAPPETSKMDETELDKEEKEAEKLSEQEYEDIDNVPVDEGRTEEEDEDEDEESDMSEPPKFPPTDVEEESKTTEGAPQYNEETQKLIDAATQARNEFDEADRKFKDIESEILKLQKLLEIDFGKENEFAPLYGQCMEYSDREYTYKLCPFDQASQRQKSGGSETSLGTWGQWTGNEENKYAKMKYQHGTTCWNGPARSVDVNLICGMENSIISVAEPNRCMYEFTVTTPAACSQPLKPADTHTHDEF